MEESDKTEKFTKIFFLAMIMMSVDLCNIRYRYDNDNINVNENHLSNIRYRYRARLTKGISGGPPLLLVLIKIRMMMTTMMMMVMTMMMMMMVMITLETTVRSSPFLKGKSSGSLPSKSYFPITFSTRFGAGLNITNYINSLS